MQEEKDTGTKKYPQETSDVRKPESGKESPGFYKIADTHPSYLTPPTPFEIRDRLASMIIKDLLGPAGGPEEELNHNDLRVRERYLVGVLAPRLQPLDAGSLDRLAADGSDDADSGNADDSMPAFQSFLPSSMGVSFVVEAETTSLVIAAEWGRYEKTDSAYQQKKDGSPHRVWKRIPVEGVSYALTLVEGNFGPHAPHEEHPYVVLQGRIRKADIGWVVTVFLVNNQDEPSRKKDEAWVFQPKITVKESEGRPVFIQRRNIEADLARIDALTREENETLEMLYRRHLEFAVGHGVSVHAELPNPGSEKALSIETTFIPVSEVAQQTPPVETDDGFAFMKDINLDMKLLSEMPREELIANCRTLETAYGSWIDREAQKIGNPGEKLEKHGAAVKRTIEKCRKTHSRIKEGIDLLERDTIAEKAFRFANEAMYHQRIHSIQSMKVRKKELEPGQGLEEIDVPRNRSWRLFQLAFVLLNLPSITMLDHEDRNDPTKAVADLLWFPTGGGKTEAYLGLSAYVMALRRLQGIVEGRRGDYGVAVLMRYTLRLLTLQQFQRAAALLCACEEIRKKDITTWGDVPFRIGLWVGNKSTPNTLKQASDALGEGFIKSSSGTPHQLTNCPWCGSPIEKRNIKIYKPPRDIGRAIIYCGDPLGQCPFTEAKANREGLPVMVVDEDIYRRPPSLLIATVDKFAQMPWKGEVQMLFGRVNGICSRHGFISPEIDDKGTHQKTDVFPASKVEPHGNLRPPDLIIQDELHLISGPLGSMVGLYETAVDELCTWEVKGRRVRPKVIASTATIRRAPEQIKKLFLRSVEVFPPQGTDIGNNFFSMQRVPGPEFPGRRYLGICAFGRRYPVTLIRVYVACLASAQVLYNELGRLADPWMTLTGYFNSIRELAGTRRLVEDDIRSRLKDVDQRGLAKRRINLGAVEELTSRKTGTDIPEILKRMDVVFDPVQEELRKKLKKEEGKHDLPYPYDAILATNMISVGVDIERLGLMVVAGQPKTTSEYIQATSRVGRASFGPGLVVTVYNWARPRDLSHYETFEHYHQTFYKHVEALSVTPFSARAFDRGLTGVFVGLMRLWESRLNANTSAHDVQDPDALMESAFDIIKRRAEETTGTLSASDAMKKLNDRRDFWLSCIRNATAWRIGYKDGSNVVGLLKQPGEQAWEDFTCLNSLRDVEGTVDLLVDTDDRGLTLNE